MRRMSQPTLGTVSVVFCDLVNSVGLASHLSLTALYNEVLSPFYASADQVIAEHGGTMRQVMAGDKILAVFGVPVEQPDDALRAVEAAVALRAKVAELSRRLQRQRDVRLEIHTGVNTGQAIIGDPQGDPAAAFGDAANLGARLQDAAGPGEILLGDNTYQLVADYVAAEPMPLTVRGKEELLTGWRLQRVDRGGISRGTWVAAPLLGRELDLALLHLTHQRVLREARCHVVNVLGLAGVGKSRLVEEFLRSLDPDTKVLRVQFQPHGSGLDYRPIMQLVQQAADVGPKDTPERIYQLVRDLVDQERTADKVMRLFAGPGSLIERDEIYRGVQRLFESLAGQRPVVVVIDDLHVAQPAALEAIRRLIELLRRSRILVVCMARSEFLADGGTLGGSIPDLHNLSLSPLPEGTVQQMLGHLLPGGEPPEALLELARAWAGGNPFYLEELVRDRIEARKLRLRGNRWELDEERSDIPPTRKIEAILGSRLSRLEEVERTVIYRAAVIGREFHLPGVLAILPKEIDPTAAPAILAGLMGKELVQDTSTPTGEGETFEFKHQLIQETAYRRIDKATRSELHLRYANWLEQDQQASAPLLEKVGFHLDKAYRDRLEELNNKPDAHARQLARRAGEYKARSGHEYARRNEVAKLAITTLRRAIELLPEGHGRRLQAQLDLAEALRDDGSPEARASFEQVLEAARQAGDVAVEMHALVGRLEIDWSQGSMGGWDKGRQELDRAVMEFVRLGDNLGLAKAHRLSAHGHMSLGESTNARQAVELAVEFVRRTDRPRLEAKIWRLYCLILFWGPTPLEEVVRKNEEALQWARARGMDTLEARALETLARCAAMRGDIDQARSLAKEARGIILDLGELLTNASDSISEGLIELLADEPDAAESALRRGYAALVERGARGPLANVAANLARVLLRKEQYDEAEELALLCKEIAAESQLDTQIKWRSLLAVVEARRGNLPEALALAREAGQRAERSEQPDSQAEAFIDIAEVLRADGQVAEARAYIDRALRKYELKGNLVAAARVRKDLEDQG
jgi:class 3 adenylate cyclase